MTSDTYIIIGSPRSGTNMLRDMLTELDGVETWPCDEINYVWRHGNIFFPNDQFTTNEATLKVKKYINKYFFNFKKTSGARKIVEKTCANSLRVEFINEVFPDAKYIFIVRDGFDVVGSAKHRWTASIDLPYLFKKVKYVPFFDIPFYACRYLYHRMYKLFSNEKRLAYWGPTLPDMDILLSKHSLLQICALQWKACLNKAESDFGSINKDNVYCLRYEDFVNDPVSEFSKLATFLDESVSDHVLNKITSKVSSSSVGKGRKEISMKEYQEIIPLIKDDLERLGYATKL